MLPCRLAREEQASRSRERSLQTELDKVRREVSKLRGQGLDTEKLAEAP